MDMGTPLKNYRHELFAFAIVKGMNQTQAAIYAGYKPSRALQTGHELVIYSDVIDRIKQLTDLTNSQDIMNVKERKEKLSDIARPCLTDFVEATQEGSHIEIDKESPGRAAIQEVTTRTESHNGEGKEAVITKLKLHDPIRAIAELNRMEHIYGEDHEMTPPAEIVQNFVFLLPDGTRLLPTQFQNPAKEVTSDDRSRKTD